MNRREFLNRGAAAGAAAALSPIAGAVAKPADQAVASAPAAFDLDEVTLDDLQRRFAARELTAVSVAERYLARIEDVDRRGPALNAVIELNPDALAIADERDRERAAGRVRGPLHGVPVLIKDNIDTADRMMTTAGSLALTGAPAPARDAFIVSRLREAGAVVLGKTNLSEWANFRSTRSTSGWSARGGQTRNPYALDRNPCGSSSGSGAAAAANLATLTVGTETDGSIVCPASICGLVGLKPTVGLVSRSGIIPISATQDTAGPMTRTVRDAAHLLAAIAGVDPRDGATKAAAAHVRADYAGALDPAGLKGARIGVARRLAGFSDRVDALFADALEVMKGLGAVLVDPADLPASPGLGDAEFDVLLFEFKAGLEAYLAERVDPNGLRTLKELAAFNEKEKARELKYFGQDIFTKAQDLGPLTTPKYVASRRRARLATRSQGIDALVLRHRLDAIVCPTTGPAWLTDPLSGDHFTGGNASQAPAISGYPHVTVPMGLIAGLPVGLSFFGRAWTEATLLRVAYAYEQATKHRQVPRFAPRAAVEDLTAVLRE
jgi:amidase